MLVSRDLSILHVQALILGQVLGSIPTISQGAQMLEMYLTNLQRIIVLSGWCLFIHFEDPPNLIEQ